MYLGQLGRYVAASRFSRRGAVVSWRQEIVSGSQKRTDRQEYPVWFCPAQASGLHAFSEVYKNELSETLFITDRSWQVIIRFEAPIWAVLTDRGRLKEFSFEGRQYFIDEYSDYLSAKTYIALSLKRSEVGSTEAGYLLTEAGNFFETEGGDNFILE